MLDQSKPGKRNGQLGRTVGRCEVAIIGTGRHSDVDCAIRKSGGAALVAVGGIRYRTAGDRGSVEPLRMAVAHKEIGPVGMAGYIHVRPTRWARGGVATKAPCYQI